MNERSAFATDYRVAVRNGARDPVVIGLSALLFALLIAFIVVTLTA